jgi:hypothetical protein
MAKKATKFFVGAVIGPWTLEKEIQKKQGNRKYLCKDKFGNTTELWTSYLSLINIDFNKEQAFEYFCRAVKEIAVFLVKDEQKKMTPGSLGFLLFGEVVSTQSMLIKFGNYYEMVLNEFAILCGKKQHPLKKTILDGKQIDSLFLGNSDEDCINYFEQKANAQLDSEKLPATCKKIKNIVLKLKEETSLCVNGYLLWTSVFDIDDYPDITRTYYFTYQNKGVKVKYMKDFFDFCGVNVTREQFQNLFNEVKDTLSK